MKTFKLLDDIYMIDNNYNAVFLIEGTEKSAIIETAYPSEFHTILKGFKSLNKRVQDFNYIIGTHIHLDHFGGVGHFLKENPNLKIIIHPKGVRHLIYPTRLNESAKQAMGDRYSIVGEMLPVDPINIIDVHDGDIFNLGSHNLKIIFTPGHAKHHIVIYDKMKDVIFTGDSIANTIRGYPPIIVTPLPNYDYNLALKSINLIRSLNAKYLIQTHGGLIELKKNNKFFENIIEQHKIWLEFVRELLKSKKYYDQKEFLKILKIKNPFNLTKEQIKKIEEKYTHVPFMNFQGISYYLSKLKSV
ncbi:MAG: MBL fold metallo-hydrolase [Candidatus Helarchaeota archaeon]